MNWFRRGGFFGGRADPPAKGVVIGGCARSGTTLLLSALSCHPEICAIPRETQLLCPTAYHPRPDSRAAFEWERFELEIARYSKSGQTYWCEKTPRNVHYFDRLVAARGESVRLIHMVRDGRDVITSSHPDQPCDYWVEPQRWIDDVRAGLNSEQHPQVLRVGYERLVRDATFELARICRFLELTPGRYFDRYPKGATVRSSNAWSERARPLHTRSVGRWRDVEHRSRADDFAERPDARALLREFGYLDAA